MIKNDLIIAEICNLSPSRIQSVFELFHNILVIELYSFEEKRNFLIYDQNQNTHTIHMQKENLPGLKTLSPIILSLKKHAIGKNISFFSNKDFLIGTIGKKEDFLNLVFALNKPYRVAIFYKEKILIQTKPTAFPDFSNMEKTEIQKVSGLTNNYFEAKEYNNLFIKYYKEKAINYEHKTLKNQLKKKLTLLENLNYDIIKCEKNISLEYRAEILKSNFHLLKKGMKEIEISDYDSLKKIIIPLNPAKNPRENIENLFNQIKKSKRGFYIINERILQVKKEISELENKISSLGNDFDISKIKSTLIKEKLDTSGAKNKTLPYKKYISSNNLEILVARSAKQGDYLTFKIAKGKEWWLHTENVAGAHVIVRFINDNLPANTLVEAAMLAKHFSKAKDDDNTDVIYTQVKYIKKPKKIGEGKVLISKKKSILIYTDLNILKRLLSSVKE